MNLNKTIDELDSFVGIPSLGSYFAIRDMTLPNTDSSATKRFSISDFMLLFQYSQNMYFNRISVSAGISSKIFPISFSSTPEVGILRVLDASGNQISGAVEIYNITQAGFTINAAEDCTVTYFVGKTVDIQTTNPLSWLTGADGDTLQYYNGIWRGRTAAQLLIDLGITTGVEELIDAPVIAVNIIANHSIFSVSIADDRMLGNPTGDIYDGKLIEIRVRQVTSGKTLTYDTQYRFGVDNPLPLLTTTDYLIFQYNLADLKWDCVQISQGF